MAIPNGIYPPPPLSSGGVVVRRWNLSSMGQPVGAAPGGPGASRLHNDPVVPEAMITPTAAPGAAPTFLAAWAFRSDLAFTGQPR